MRCIMDLLNVLTMYLALVYTNSLQAAPDNLRITPSPTDIPKIRIVATATPMPTAEPTPEPTVGPSPLPLPSMTPNKEYRQLKFKDKGEDVMRLQSQLYKYGYYSGAIDGSYGPQTVEAVRLFQKLHSLSADGIAGRQTLTILYESEQILMLSENELPETSSKEAVQTLRPENAIVPIALPTAVPTLVPTAQP